LAVSLRHFTGKMGHRLLTVLNGAHKPSLIPPSITEVPVSSQGSKLSRILTNKGNVKKKYQ
jgi:hypothetical protein